MKKSFTALAFGTFGLGITEFVMMGILPYAAKELGISIPAAGPSYRPMHWAYVQEPRFLCYLRIHGH